MNDILIQMPQPRSWQTLFPAPKPILAMLHLGGTDASERLERACTEAAALRAGGVDAVIVENYFGDADDVRRVLEALTVGRSDGVLGLNVLRDTELAFALAEEFPVDFIQIDSVAGHLDPAADDELGMRLAELRAASSALVFGGVRFKYQPVNSGRPEAEDLALGADRSDAIVVTGEGTGMQTDLEKIQRFRRALPETTPLIVGAGVTEANVAEQLRDADAAIVGSFFKDTYLDTGVVEPAHVERLMRAVAAIRAEL